MNLVREIVRLQEQVKSLEQKRTRNERLECLLWDLKQRRLEGVNELPHGNDASDGWFMAWDEVAEAMRDWGFDPEELGHNPASTFESALDVVPLGEDYNFNIRSKPAEGEG